MAGDFGSTGNPCELRIGVDDEWLNGGLIESSVNDFAESRCAGAIQIL